MTVLIWGCLGWGLGWAYVRGLERMVAAATRQRALPLTTALMMGVGLRQVLALAICYVLWRTWPDAILPLLLGFVGAWTLMRVQWLRRLRR